jgi:hypothetical protein
VPFTNLSNFDQKFSNDRSLQKKHIVATFTPLEDGK